MIKTEKKEAAVLKKSINIEEIAKNGLGKTFQKN